MKAKIDETDTRYAIVAVFITFCLLLAFFGGYILQTYQTDTYAKWMYSLSDYKTLFFNQARYAEWLYVRISFLFGSNPPHDQWFHVSLALILNGIIILTIWYKLYRKIKLEGFGILMNLSLILAVISMRVHVFGSDIFQYDYAAAVTSMGDMCAILSAYIASERRSALSCIGAFLLLCLSLSFTQASLFWFVLISMLLYFINYLHDPKGFHIIKELLKRIGLYAAACAWVLLCFRLFVRRGMRGDVSGIDLKATLYSVCKTALELFRDCLGVMPDYFYSVLLMLVLTALGVVVLSMSKRGMLYGKQKTPLVIGLTLAGVYGAIFPTALFDIWLPHRIVYGFVTILPLSCIMLLTLFVKSNRKIGKSYIMPGILGILLINILVNWHSTIEIYKGQIVTNTVDQQDAVFYYSQIQKYEEETGREIKNIAYMEDAHFTWSLPGVIAAKSINNRAYSTEWGRREIIPFVSGREFGIVPFDEAVYEEYFKDKDWKMVSEEQVKCIEDTAFIMLY